ncbi:MAG: hypothetical protein WCZ66_00675 [Sphingomonadaceae bacterium]
MAKWVSADVLDGALLVVAEATRMVAVSGQPLDYVSATAGVLAETALSAADFVAGAGAASGRKITVTAKSDVAVTTSGTADHVALLDEAGSRLLYVTTCPAQVLTAGGTANFAAWTIEVGAPF